MVFSVYLLLYVSKWFVLVVLQGMRLECSLLLPGNLLAYVVNLLLLDSFFTMLSFQNR